MFKPSMYERRDEVVTRLKGSVIMYGRRPVRVVDVGQEKELYVTLLRSGKRKVIQIDDEKLSLELPKLGYVNTSRGAVYLKRRPVRLYKQGLVSGNVVTVGDVRVDELLSSRNLADMLQRKYPTMQQAIASSSNNPFRSKPIAFSPDLAVQGSTLFYRGNQVGSLTTDGEFRLSEDFTHLREAILEALHA